MDAPIEQLKCKLDKIKSTVFELIDNSQIVESPPLPRRKRSDIDWDAYSSLSYGKREQRNRTLRYKWSTQDERRQLQIQTILKFQYNEWYSILNIKVIEALSVNIPEKLSNEINRSNINLRRWIEMENSPPRTKIEARKKVEEELRPFYKVIELYSNIVETEIKSIEKSQNIIFKTMRKSNTSNPSSQSNTLSTLNDICGKLKKILKKSDNKLEKGEIDRLLFRALQIASSNNLLMAHAKHLEDIQNEPYLFSLSVKDISKIVGIVESMIDMLNITPEESFAPENQYSQTPTIINNYGNNSPTSIISGNHATQHIKTTNNNSFNYERLKELGVTEDEVSKLKTIESDNSKNSSQKSKLIIQWLSSVTSGLAARELFESIPAVTKFINNHLLPHM